MRKIPLVLLSAAIGVGAGAGLSKSHLVAQVAMAASPSTYRELSLFSSVFEKVRTDYVEKPDDKKLIENALDGMVNNLDPHSNYMNQKSYDAMQTETSGEFGGLGIEVSLDKGYLKVVSPIDDTPASRAGILSGDTIIAIDGTDVKTLSLEQAVDKMRGKPDTSVKLTILRGTDKKKVDVALVREIIRVKSVTSKIDGDIGYIRISEFTEQSYDGLKTAMAKIKKDIPADKFKGYILDLRNNPGGLLDQAIQVVNVFVDHGEIVSTRGRHKDETQRFNARPGLDLSGGKPMVVLINGGSASASEIVAGALQDHKRATLIGTRSFGKGSVQTIIPLGPSNGALRLTTARYFTPSGRSIQAEGIVPEIRVLQDVPEALKGKDSTGGEASLKGHLLNGPDEKKGSQAYIPPDPKDDKAMIAAEHVLHGDKNVAANPEPSTDKPAMPATPAAPAAATPAPVTPAAPATPAEPAPATPAAPAK
ncbi:MAG: S41 family peptidase [Hyphomicrobiales bacterium]|nr:S41 family peptidase [Hyphomicrobiales bacterium]MDE2113517.1 S41 family peptidase [Hyphomicrobiales bacterium]